MEKWLESRINERFNTRLKLLREQAKQVVIQLIEVGPKYTGASSGVRGLFPIYKSHPAYGMTIGNILNGGDSGWQINETARRKDTVVSLIISNPMWEHYLKYVNAGEAPKAFASSHNFVRKAWLIYKAAR